MKKIINGSRYNTETAQRLGVHENNYLPNDIYYRGQDLYRTKAGKYFIHNYGNGFPKQDGNWGWGEEITPITEDAAREWAEFLSTLSLRRATAKVHKTVGHFCAYETNFMGIASSC